MLRTISAFVFVLQFALALGANARPTGKDKYKPNSHPEAALRAQEPCKVLIVGFNGGLDTPNNSITGIVRLRDRVNTPEFPGVCFRNFLPYSWPRAYFWILHHYPKHGGRFTKEEVERSPKIVIMGHSLGGMTTLIVARLLGRRGIPVDLTIQIVSLGLADNTVPSNVKNAANFYVHGPIGFWTKKNVKVKDPTATHFIGNIPVTGYDHLSITRSPQVANLVIDTARSLLTANPAPRPLPADPSPH